MAKNVVIRDVTYNSVPSVTIPLASSNGNAEFFDISDATIDNNSKLLNGVTAYGAGGTKYTGNIPNKSSSDLTVNGATITAPAGYYESTASKSVASGTATIPADAYVGVTITIDVEQSTGTINVGATGTESITPQVTAGYISSGTAGNVSVAEYTSTTLSTRGAQTYTPTTSNQKIAKGLYLTGDQTIAGDANLVASNIVSGKSIFGVAGSAQIPVISQDATTKVLSIS